MKVTKIRQIIKKKKNKKYIYIYIDKMSNGKKWK